MQRSNYGSIKRIADSEGPAVANRAPAVARTAIILRLLASSRSGLGVIEIARRVGLVPSTCLHILRALVDEGFVTFNPGKKTYRIGVGLLTLVREAMANSDYPKAVQPALNDLTAEYKVTAVAVESDHTGRMVVVALSRSNSLVSLHINVGSRYPAYTGATGRLVAAGANLPRDELKEKFDTISWEKEPRFEDWCEEVERARVEGVAVDRGNTMKGLTSIATLIPPGADRAVRAIVLMGFDHQMTERSLRQLKQSLLQTAKSVVDQLN